MMPSTLPPVFSQFATGKMTRLELNPDIMTSLQVALRVSLHQGSFAEWVNLAVYRTLGRMVTDMETGDLSTSDAVSRLRTVVDLSSSLGRAIGDRVSQDTFVLWALELLRRDSELASVPFLDEDTRKTLRAAPMCFSSVSSSVTDPEQGTMFHGLELLLPICRSECVRRGGIRPCSGSPSCQLLPTQLSLLLSRDAQQLRSNRQLLPPQLRQPGRRGKPFRAEAGFGEEEAVCWQR